MEDLNNLLVGRVKITYRIGKKEDEVATKVEFGQDV